MGMPCRVTKELNEHLRKEDAANEYCAEAEREAIKPSEFEEFCKLKAYRMAMDSDLGFLSDSIGEQFTRLIGVAFDDEYLEGVPQVVKLIAAGIKRDIMDHFDNEETRVEYLEQEL